MELEDLALLIRCLVISSAVESRGDQQARKLSEDVCVQQILSLGKVAKYRVMRIIPLRVDVISSRVHITTETLLLRGCTRNK